MIRIPCDDSTPGPNTFNRAVRLVDRSEAETLLNDWQTTDRGVGGAPRRRPGYNIRAVLILHLLCALTGRPLTFTAAWGLAWAGLNPDQLARLNLDTLINPESRTQLLADQRTANAEYERFRDYSEHHLYDPIDPSAHRRQLKRTNQALTDEKNNISNDQKATLQRNRERLHTLLNRLLAASVNEPHPAHWHGDLIVDGHELAIARAGHGTNTGTRPERKHGYDPDAGYWMKHRRLGHAWVHQLTVLMRVHRTYERQVAQVAIGIAIGPPNSGDTHNAIAALDAATSNGLGKRPRARPELIADQGYTTKDNFAEHLHERGYRLVQQQPQRQTAAATPGSKHNTTATRLNNGAWLINGVPLCEGGWAPDADTTPGNHIPALPILPPSHKDMTDRDFVTHHALERRLEAATMITNGRPRKSLHGAANTPNARDTATTKSKRHNGGKPGRPATNTAPDPVWLLQVGCPASALNARCPRLPASLTLNAATHVTLRPPNTPPEQWPATCTNTWSTGAIKPQHFKQTQSRLTGTWNHDDRYRGARAVNEQYFSQFTGRWNGGLTETSRHATGTARVGFVATLAVIATNMRMQDAYDHKTRTNNNQPPWCPRRAQATERQARLNQLLGKNKPQPHQ